MGAPGAAPTKLTRGILHRWWGTIRPELHATRPLATTVECYAGYRGEETPRRFRFGERQVDIVDVVSRWLTPDHRYFKVKDAQSDLYILREDVSSGRWELT